MFDLSNIFYPSYAIAMPYSSSLIYIPTQGSVGLFSVTGEERNLIRFSSIKNIKEVVLEGYEQNNRLCFYDAIPVKDFNNKKCSLIYEERLVLLHQVLYSYLAEPNLYIEAFSQKAYNPKELKNFYANCLTNGYKGVTIKNSYGKYSWGKLDDNTLELIPKG